MKKLPEDIKAARVISQIEFERIVNRYLFISPAAIKEDMQRLGATAFECLLGGIITDAISKKDEKKAEWLIARTLGKMRDRLEIESKSLRVTMHASAALPSIEQLALENPDLSASQLHSFADKISKLREEIAKTKKFEREFIELGAADVEDR